MGGMGRRKTEMAVGWRTIVYRYGLRPPVENAELVDQIMLAGHRFRNELTRVSWDTRALLRQVEAPKSGDVPALAEEVEAAKAEVERLLAIIRKARGIKDRKARKARDRTPEIEAAAALRAARERRKLAQAALSAARHAARKTPEVAAAWKAAQLEQNARTRAAWGASGLASSGPIVGGWGTLQLVQDAAIAASASMPLYRDAEPCDPKFKRWNREGAVGVQLHQKGEEKAGLRVDEVMSREGDAANWLYVARVRSGSGAATPPRTPAVAVARARNAAARAAAIERRGMHLRQRDQHLAMRVASEGREPVMARWPIKMHRPLPSGAIVKRAAIYRRMIGPREEWSCAITLDVPPRTISAARGTVAVELGWHDSREARGGIRVARWIDDEGNGGQLVLDAGSRGAANEVGVGTRSAICKADEIRSGRDRDFDRARAELVADLRRLGVPGWMRALTVRRGVDTPSEAQALAHVAKWKSAARLAALALRWRQNRFGGDGEAFARLEAWRYHDRHLWAWESSQRKGSARRRRDDYRRAAASLADRYARVVFADVAFSEMSRRPDADGDPHIAAVAKNQKDAAPGELRLAVQQAVAARGGLFEKIPLSYLVPLAHGLEDDDCRPADLGNGGRGKKVDRGARCPACGGRAAKIVTDHLLDCRCGYQEDLDVAACLVLLDAAGVDVRAILNKQGKWSRWAKGAGHEAAE